MARDKEEQYRKDWRDLLDKFSPEMKEKINSDQLYRNAFMCLLHGESPFFVIESLLEICADDREKIMELILNQKIRG